jgi:hypothetical protein
MLRTENHLKFSVSAETDSFRLIKYADAGRKKEQVLTMLHIPSHNLMKVRPRQAGVLRGVRHIPLMMIELPLDVSAAKIFKYLLFSLSVG